MSAPPGDAVVDFGLIREKAETALLTACKRHLDGKSYDVKYQTQWSDAVTQTAVDALVELSPNFKFVVSCLLLELRESQVHSECVASWDPKTDGSVHAEWKNASMLCILHAFASAI
ncbi:Tctex-1 [Pelagophyceae sp. CCMP2097]|nr:Tctex-1 [Pelagophyceae sp. CCMP2097]